jgi:uncharacterized protein (DUF952 family)
MGSSRSQPPAATGVRLLSQTFGVARLFPLGIDVSCLTFVTRNAGSIGQSDGMTSEHPDPRLLVHLCPHDQWNVGRTAGELRPDSLLDTGFVHLSAQHQVHLPANRIFGGRTDLVLLYIDPAALNAPLRWEPGVPGDPEAMLFPHLYGALPVAAVVEVGGYRPGPDGLFAPLTHGPDV